MTTANPRCSSAGHRPDDDAQPDERCRDCGQPITWTGPGPHDWELSAISTDGAPIEPSSWRCCVSSEAAAVIAGLVAPTTEVDQDGVHVRDEVWAEIRAAFPVVLFWKWREPRPRRSGVPAGRPGVTGRGRLFGEEETR